MIFLITFAAAFLILFRPDSFAGEGPTPGRKIYNTIMLLVNFGILVFFFLRYAKKPLMEFFRNVRKKIEENLNKINDQFNEVKVAMDAEAAKMKEIEQHIDEIRKNIVAMGTREKEKIIEQAKITADKMIEDAKSYASYQIAKVRKALSDEMIDISISMVKERLIKGISEQDNEKLVDRFILDLGTSKGHTNIN